MKKAVAGGRALLVGRRLAETLQPSRRRQSARNIPPAIHQSQYSDEDTDGGEKQNQNSTPQSRAALRPRRRRALVAHRASLRDNARQRQRNQSRQAGHQQTKSSCDLLFQSNLQQNKTVL